MPKPLGPQKAINRSVECPLLAESSLLGEETLRVLSVRFQKKRTPGKSQLICPQINQRGCFDLRLTANQNIYVYIQWRENFCFLHRGL
jgi:hypothetical protein